MPTNGRFESYDEAVAAHAWNVPERYNIAADVCDKPPARQARDGLWEDYRGNERRGALGRAAGARAPGSRASCGHERRRARRSGRDAAHAAARDGCGVPRARSRPAPILLSLSVLYGDEGIRHRDHRRAGEGPRHQRRERRAGASSWTCRSTQVLVLDERLVAGRATRASRRIDTRADDPAQLYYTSGTTGLAKGILHAHRYLLGAQGVRATATTCATASCFHGMGEWAWVGGNRAPDRAVATTARCRSCTSGRAASTRTSSSRSSRSTR